MRFLILQEASGQWFWELRNQHGETVCVGAKSFDERYDAIKAIHQIRRIAPGALVFDPLGTLYEKVASTLLPLKP